MKTMEEIKKKVFEIAAANLYTVEKRGDLEPRDNDGEDFIEVSVWGLEQALMKAFDEGRKSR